MLKMNHFWIAFIIFSSFRGELSTSQGYYTIVAPGTIKPESVFHISFTLNDFHESCWFNISFTTFFKNSKFHEYDSIEVEPRTTKMVELYAPSFDSTLANLEVLGHCGMATKDTALIYFEPDQYWVFIQTNKMKYKPGELVQFRVICIDQLTRPAKVDQIITVQIYDDQHNLVKGFFDVKLVQGVFKSELQLSNYPVLGLWKIRVISDKIFREKTFEVDTYVLPKFNVQINTRKAICIGDDHIELEISANNFYGEPIKGNLSISLSNTDLPIHKWVPTPPTITRESQIDGKTTIFINLKNDLQLEEEHEDQRPVYAFSAPITPYKFHINVTVIDSTNGELSWTTTEIEVNLQPFKIDLQAPSLFESDEILNIKVQVSITDFQDNPIQDIKTPVEIVVGCFEKIERYIRSYTDFDEVRIEYRNEIGSDFSIISVTNKNYTECYLYAEYQRIKSSTERMYKKVKEFSMDVLTENPEEGEELEIKITNPDPFEEFSYEIISRGDIIQSGHVYVPGNQTTYILRLNVTFLMVPKITIYAHHIKNKNFGGHLKDVIIKRALTNSIKITTVDETSPGSSVCINVSTDEGSYIGLMGLDGRTLQNIDEENILNEDYVNMKLGSVNSVKTYSIPFYGRTADIITFSNVFPPGMENGPIGGDLSVPLSNNQIPKLFPESWLYEDFERVPARSFNILKNVPETITTWAITGFSLHPDTGLTFTEKTTNLKVSQDFFVSMDLPSLVKEGEIIEVPIYISNYMQQDVLTNVTIASHSEDLHILEDPEAIFKLELNISKLISTEKREKLLIFLKPLKQGHYNVTVKAVSSVASDAVRKTLNVQLQGIPYTITKSYLVHQPEESIQEDEITIDIPEHAVPESQRVEVSVVGDIFRPLIRHLEKLAEDPYVNGEDNMKLIVSNLIILKYLKALNCSDSSLESKMKLNLELVYQNQLSFKYLDGSFGFFEGTGQRTGDIWQTIFALWGLIQAKDLIHIDSNVIDKGLVYIRSKQQENGCFKSESGIEDDVKFTALGLMVFLMDEHSRTKHSAVIAKGLAYLYDSSNDLEFTPISAVAAYVLILGKHEKAGEFLRKFNPPLTTKKVISTSGDTLQSQLEMTAGSLMNLLESQNLQEESFLPIIKGLLLSQKGQTHITHMIAIQAMFQFVDKLLLNTTNLRIHFKDDQNNSGDFRLNHENAQVFQTVELSTITRKIKLQSRGRGLAVIDVKHKYNLVPETQSSSLYDTNISFERYSNFLTSLRICTRGHENRTENKLTITDINLESGYIFTNGDFNNLENQDENIKSLQFNDSRNEAEIYIENIPSKEACVQLEVRRAHKIFNSKPGWVIVYGRHDKDQRTITSFHINGS